MRTRENEQAGESPLTAAAVTKEMVESTRRGGVGFWLAALALGALFVVGIVGIGLRLVGGFGDPSRWGYYAATFGFLFTISTAAPAVAAGLRFTKSDWSRWIARIAELFAIPGILMLFWMIPILWLIPPVQGRITIWFDWPLGAPLVYDVLAVVLVELTALALLYLSAVPDFAAIRDARGPGRAGLYGRLALNWRGTKRQWRLLRRGLIVLGGLYAAIFFLAHLLVSVDWAMSLMPAWRSAVFPSFHALTSLETGVAAIILAMALLRWIGGYRQYLRFDHFWSLAKLLIPLTLLYVYLWWSEFLTSWYGRTPREESVLSMTMFGPYFAFFAVAILFSFLFPLILLATRWGRKTFVGSTVVSVVILIGIFADRLRIYVSSYSASAVPGGIIGNVPPTHFPDVADILIAIGGLAGLALLYLLALRFFAPVSVWQARESLLLRTERRVLGTHVDVLAKPE